MSESLENQRIVVTGASGLIGSALVAALAKAGADVVRAVRRPVRDEQNELYWNPSTGAFNVARLEGVDAVVHLAGENIGGHRWTDSFKEKIRASRINGTRLVSEAIARATGGPRTFVCASAIGYYGDRGDETLTEDSPPGDDFLAEVCREWEATCGAARDAGVRVINTRTGVVLSPRGGALKRMLTPFKLGAGGPIGDGRQWMSWIALDDVAGAICFLLAHPELGGPINLAAPNPVTNRDFTKSLGRVLSRPTIIPMPAFAAQLAFGEMADALLLSSTKVSSDRLTDAGYQFAHPELREALRHMLGR